MKAEIYTAQAAMQCNMKERRHEDGVTGRVPRLAGERPRAICTVHCGTGVCPQSLRPVGGCHSAPLRVHAWHTYIQA